jgi:hypothetical protein
MIVGNAMRLVRDGIRPEKFNVGRVENAFAFQFVEFDSSAATKRALVRNNLHHELM